MENKIYAKVGDFYKKGNRYLRVTSIDIMDGKAKFTSQIILSSDLSEVGKFTRSIDNRYYVMYKSEMWVRV